MLQGASQACNRNLDGASDDWLPRSGKEKGGIASERSFKEILKSQKYITRRNVGG